jgi:hypothetical protein
MKNTAIAAMSIAVVLFASTVASAQVCVVAIIAKAIYASAQDNRELTAKEAMTCGLLGAPETAKDAKAKPATKKVARKSKDKSKDKSKAQSKAKAKAN